MLYSGGWDREVRFWDVRTNQLSSSIGNRTSICGDSVDVSSDNRLVATGGGTLGEGVQIWDFRNLREPLMKLRWDETPDGESLNPVVTSVRFVPGLDMVLVGCSGDDKVSAKCFDTMTGEVIEDFHRVAGNCFTLDVSSDSTMVCFGDSKGAVHFENIDFVY